MSDSAVLPTRSRGRTALLAVEVVALSVLLIADLVICGAGVPDALLGRLVAAFPCGDADLDPAHPACGLADPDRAELGLLLVLPLPVLATLLALAGTTALLVLRRRGIAIALAAMTVAASLAGLLAGKAILAVELERIVHR